MCDRASGFLAKGHAPCGDQLDIDVTSRARALPPRGRVLDGLQQIGRAEVENGCAQGIQTIYFSMTVALTSTASSPSCCSRYWRHDTASTSFLAHDTSLATSKVIMIIADGVYTGE